MAVFCPRLRTRSAVDNGTQRMGEGGGSQSDLSLTGWVKVVDAATGEESASPSRREPRTA